MAGKVNLSRRWPFGTAQGAILGILTGLIGVFAGIQAWRVHLSNDILMEKAHQRAVVVHSLEAVSSSLEAQSSYEESPGYVERMAREQLNLVKPGDHVLRVRIIQSTTATVVVAATPVPTPTPLSTPPASSSSNRQPLWKRWLQLLTSP
ncbi:MAG: septum formation initiator family protein [Chloroflexi bacterium]|nr:septum formation initiator family protein [Chloroflexota bacterium]